jgi:putative transposase
MNSNAAGDMVLLTWRRLADQFPGVVPDVAVAMPDHFHGIIMLGTDPAVTTRPSLSAVVGAFKSLTSVAYGHGVRTCGWRPYVQHLWHRSFRDTVIRTDQSLATFRAYIEGNPGRWSEKQGE